MFTRGRQERELGDRLIQLMALFAPGIAAAGDDPRAILSWQPLAVMARKLFPEECAELDRVSGATFPFSADKIQAAHARWTTDWLAWETRHDSECKLKVAEIEAALAAPESATLRRARLDAVERDKLERYQSRYTEYVKVAKALQALM